MKDKTGPGKTEVAKKLSQLYWPLVGLVDVLQAIEKGGTLADAITIGKPELKGSGLENTELDGAKIEFTAEPLMLTITTNERKMILRVLELE
ncbi:MAG TPA: hypothetical protein VMR45_00940 [Patescibacteria group bacterium]|nr:hypothetical protein [Patescibacteria group bacterium]